MGAVVSLTNVTVRYGSGSPVLDVPSFALHEGDILAMLGPNGAGKSTLLRVIALLSRPATGEVHFRGRIVSWSRAREVRRRMAMAFQEPLLTHATVAENVALGLRFRGIPAAERRPRIERWLGRLGIAQLASRPARTLSGGEAQRCALARALVLEPELLLLDEPFGALDQPSREALMAEVGAILRRDRITTVLVTHDRDEARALADRVAVMLGGRIAQTDATDRLFRAPVSDEVARFVGVETIVDGRIASITAGLALVEVGHHKIEVAASREPGERVRVCLRPEDVTLVPAGVLSASTARNRLAGTVSRVTSAGLHARVMVDCGFPIVALVTYRSMEELGLGEGTPVVVVFKATAPHLIPLDGPA
jgi:molybdopterin-binding protein